MTDYTLVYWPLPFRGHFVRFVLSHVGACWDEPGRDEVKALKSAPVATQDFPFMAPPSLSITARGKGSASFPPS